ncbi:hypothetical protein FNF29_05503 [Cafeteria roenbergensis]|uniref:Uncharacterized protein n=2 Tax=Cafeteria roenbergensis TaxID=33653 RepID=A0A5A8CAB0_CAFRO|nr:hypothetical protein FNF29_05503 [Cafeteria roenbergensis]|eukprot:KAA0150063.1 hypothetical protein FNF29_05503 [Cafeteria roenbergensis]
MQAQLGVGSTFIAFQDSVVTIYAPPAAQAALAKDGDPDTCMDWNIGGYDVLGVRGGNDGALSIDLGRVYDVENVRVLADQSVSAFDRQSLLAMISVRFSETPISQASGDCAKDAGLAVWVDSQANTGSLCDDCTCLSCPSDSFSWPPDGRTMTKAKSARYIVVNLRGLDNQFFSRADLCGHNKDEWEVPLCHVEISVRFCEAGYFFNDATSKCNLCPLGSYCPGGYIRDASVAAPQSCPAGVFGDKRGLSAATCNGPCANGYDCSAGGVGDRTAVECTDPTAWCFGGRAFQTQSGFRAVASESGLMIGEEQCTPGQYCLNGVQNPVQAGYFSSRRGETNQKGMGKCEAGFRCPAGSSSSQAVPCVDPSVFCPEGSGSSGQPVRALPIAYYGVSQSKGGFTVYVSEALCPAGSYCQEGVRYTCAPGLLAESTGLASEFCDGRCPAGFYCDSEGSKTSCPAGFYCELGTLEDPSKPYNGLGACGPGTFQPAVQAMSADQCIKCDPKTASSAVAATSGQTCVSCHPQSTTPAGAAKCTPKLISVVADDDGADKTPGISDLDVVIFTFDRATNKTAVDTQELLSHVVRFDPEIGAPLRGSWEQGGKVLRVTLLSVPETVDPFATRIGALRARLLPGSIKDESGLSTTADDEQEFVVGGTWGESSRPKFSIAALVPAPRGQRLARATPSGSLLAADWAPFPLKGDRIVLGFDQPVKRVPIDTQAGLADLLSWSVQPARAFSAAWNTRSTVLTLTVSEPHPLSELNASFVASLQAGRLGVAVRVSAGLTSIDGSSVPSNASRAVTGTLATAPLNARVEQHTPGSLLVLFQPAQLPAGEVIASNVAATGLAPPLTVTHTIVRWCVGRAPGAAGAACDHAAVSVTPVSAGGASGNGSVVLPGDSMLIVSTSHAPIAPGTAVHVWVAAATSDGRVWEWVPAADGEPALHAAEAASSAVCRTSPGSRSVGTAADAPAWQLAQAAGFKMSLNEEASCACSLEALPAAGPSSAASMFASEAAARGTPAGTTIAAVTPAGVGSPCDPAAPPSGLPEGTACRCRSVVSGAATLEEAVLAWFDASAPLAPPCDGSPVLVQAPAILGMDAPGELSTQGGEAVRVHGRGLGLLPPSLKSASADHAAFVATAYVAQRAAVAAFASAAAMTPLGAVGSGSWPAPPAAAPSPRASALEHRAAGVLLPLSSVSVSNPSGFEHALQLCTIECSQLSLRCETTPGIGRDYRPTVRVGSVVGGLDEAAVLARRSASSSLREVERLALSDAGGDWVPAVNSSINCTAIAVDGLRACIRYGPPVISSFAGNGSQSAVTAGGQNVRIQGRQLGPTDDVDRDPSLMVTYSPLSSGRVFQATHCRMTKPHEELECYTAQGAGAQLSWEVIIGRQRSVVPRTSYGAPVLTSVRLFDAAAGDVAPAAGTPGFPFDRLDAFPKPESESRLSTAGGDWVVLEGSDLGPNMSFVTRVALSSSGGSGAGETALEQTLFAWSGDPFDTSSQTEDGSSAAAASPSPELCWMTVPHSAILCQTVPGAGTGLRAEVSVLGAQSQRTEQALAYAPPSASLKDRLTVPTQGASGVAVVLRNAPPDVSLLAVEVLGVNVTSFSMQPVVGVRGEAVVSVTIPALPGTTGSISTVPVRLSARGQTADVALGVDAPSISLLDVDSIVNASAVAASPPLPGATASATVLMELQGSSLGSNHAVFRITVGGDNCTVLDKAAIRKYIVAHRVEESLDSHTRLFCWTTRRSGSVIIQGQPGFRGFDFPPLARTYSYSELKRAPSPRRVLPVTNATRLAPMGGQFVAVEGTDIFKEGQISVEFLYLDNSNENLAPDDRPVIASLPCLVQTRGQAAARWPAPDPCIEQGVFDLAPVGEAQRNQLCASTTKVLCRTMRGRGQGLFVRVVSNSLSGVSASALVGFAAPKVVRATPGTGPTAGGFELTLSLVDGGDRDLPEDFNVAVPAPAGLAPLARQGTVSVGGKDCPVSHWDDTKVVCSAPAGVSAAPVVEVRREQSATLPAGGFAYAPPEVFPLSLSTWPFPAEGISPDTPDGNATRSRLAAAVETVAQAEAALAAGGGGLESLGAEFQQKLRSARLVLANGDGPGTALYAMPTDGDRVSLVVWGENFGPSPTITLSRLVKVTSGTGATSVTTEQVPCVAEPSQSSHTYAVCRVGEGLGSNINVTVNTGVRSATAPWLVHFQRPAVTGLYVDTLRVDPADWVTAVTSVVSGRKLTTDVDAGFRPAVGGFLIHILGTAFSAAPQVSVGGMPCRVLFAELQPDLISGVGRIFASAAVPGNDGTPAAGTTAADIALLASLGVAATAPIPARWTVDHRRVVCAAPPGIGRRVDVLVSAGGLASEPVQLDYDAPSVQLTVRGFARAGSAAGLETPLGPASITVQGSSFGPAVLGSSAGTAFAMRPDAADGAGILAALPSSTGGESATPTPAPSSDDGGDAEAGGLEASGVGPARARLLSETAQLDPPPAPAVGYLEAGEDALGSGGEIVDVLVAPWRAAAADSSGVSGERPALRFKRLCSAETMAAPDVSLQCDVRPTATVDISVLMVRVADAASHMRGLLTLCPEQWYGGLGELCRPCPQGAACPGGFVEPLPLPGFFKRGRSGFSQCVPETACQGFVSSSGGFDFDQMQLGSGVVSSGSAASSARLLRRVRELEEASGPKDLSDVPSVKAALEAIRAAWAGGEAALTGLFPMGGPVSKAWVASQALNEQALQSQCAAGYAGDRCSVCDDRFYRLEADCVPCPDLGWLYMLVGGVVVVILIGMAYLLQRSQINLSGASVGVDFMQSVALFATLGFRWPVEFKIVLSTIGSANLNLQLLAPSCAIDWSPEIQFYLIVALPLGLTMAAVSAAALVRITQAIWRVIRKPCGCKRDKAAADATGGLHSAAGQSALAEPSPLSFLGRKRAAAAAKKDQPKPKGASSSRGLFGRKRKEKPDPPPPGTPADEDTSLVDIILGAAFSILYFAYLTVCRTSIQWFDCFPIARPDGSEGERVLDADPSIVCDVNESPVYGRVLPLAYVSTVVYGAGVPVVFALILFVYQKEITADQVLRERGEGNSPRTNPNYAVRKRFGRIYGDFRAGFTTWRVALLIRKLALVAVALLFSRQALFAGTLSVLILFISYAAHVKYRPFLATAALSQDFLKLAQEEGGDGLDAKDLLARSKAGPKRSASAGRLDAASAGKAKSGPGGRPAASRSGSSGRGRARGRPRVGLGKVRQDAEAESAARAKAEEAANACTPLGILARIGRALCPVMVLCMNDAEAKRRLRVRRAVRRVRERRRSSQEGQQSIRRATAIFNEMQGQGLLSEADVAKANGGEAWTRCRRVVCCCYYCCCKRSGPRDINSLSTGELQELAALASESSLGYQFDYNALESSYLSSSITILVGGMVFSTVDLVHGSLEYVLLTTFLTVIIASAGASFLYLLLFELYRSVRFAHVFAIARQYEDRLRFESTSMQRHIRGIDVVFKRADKDKDRLAEVGRMLMVASSNRSAAGSAGGAAGPGKGGGGGPTVTTAARSRFRAAALQVGTAAVEAGQSAAGRAALAAVSSAPVGASPRNAGTSAPSFAPPSTPKRAAPKQHTIAGVANLALERLRQEKQASEAGVRSGRLARHNAIALMARAASESGRASSTSTIGSIAMHRPPDASSSRRIGGKGTSRVARALLRSRRPLSSAAGEEGSGRVLLARRQVGLDGAGDDSDASASTASMLTPRRLDEVDAAGMGFGPDATPAAGVNPLRRAVSDSSSSEPHTVLDGKAIDSGALPGVEAARRLWLSQPAARGPQPSPLNAIVAGARKGFGGAGVPLPARRQSTIPPGPGRPAAGLADAAGSGGRAAESAPASASSADAQNRGASAAAGVGTGADNDDDNDDNDDDDDDSADSSEDESEGGKGAAASD